MATVRLERISKHFGAVRVIENLDLQIEDREFLVLVGPSGCGKSTVLRLIAGLEELTAGTIRIGEHVVYDVAPKDRDIAMVVPWGCTTIPRSAAIPVSRSSASKRASRFRCPTTSR